MTIGGGVGAFVAAHATPGEGAFLLARRGPGRRHAGLWELPGGKVEAGETPEAALGRELQEELGLEVEVGAHVATIVHDYGPGMGGVIELIAHEARIVGGAWAPVDHDALAWVEAGATGGFALAEADVPIVYVLAEEARGALTRPA